MLKKLSNLHIAKRENC